MKKYDFLNIPTVGVLAEYNTVLKRYKNNDIKILFTSYSKLKGITRDNKKIGSSSKEELERYNYLNMLNVKQTIIDIATNNGNWQYFVTLTFDDELIDAYSHEIVSKKLKNWIDVQRRSNPNIKYLLVPELCKSGRLHFHGLFSNVENWKLSPAINEKTGRRIIKNGSPIFNLDNYKLGYTTVSEVKSQEAVMVYISKYISKDLLNLKNKKHYWRSRNLILPEYEYYNTSLDDIKDYLKEYITDNNIKYSHIDIEENYTTAVFQFSLNDDNGSLCKKN